MAFLIHTVDDGRNIPIEYLPSGAITPKVGMALTMSAGQLNIAMGATKPTYISMTERETLCNPGTILPVIRVEPDIVFETAFSVTPSSVQVGSKVTIANNGMQVTATATDGVAEVVYKDGTAAGSMCRVRFS